MAYTRNVNDSHSTILNNISKCMSTAKTIFHLVDDPLVATEKALNITSPGFMLAADTVVASVFFIVSAIELHESINELQELNKEYDEIKNRQDEEANVKKVYLKKRKNICISNIILSGGALIASTILLVCTAASLAFGGIAFFPFAIMMAILTKQCSEFYMLKDELKELLAIKEPTLKQSEKIIEIQDKLFYKKMEITAQALITFGFLASVVAMSVFSAGMVPTLFVIGGAIFGLIFKIHGKYHEYKKELQEKLEHQTREIDDLKKQVDELKKERKSSNLSQHSLLKKSHSSPNLSSMPLSFVR